VYATWDDHEVDDNFAFGHTPLGPAGLRAFREYWPVAGADDLARRFRWGRWLELFLLDTRRHRDPACRPDGPGKTMLGAHQRRWLVDALAASDARWKVVVSSVPLSIAKGFPCGDTWAARWLFLRHTGFAAERDALLAELGRRGVRELVVLAGDVHFASIATLRPPTGPVVHELIAGPLAARPKSPRDPDDALRPAVRFQAGGIANFGELAIDADGGLTVRILDATGQALVTERIAAGPA
jgi:alkaline phosphatase D